MAQIQDDQTKTLIAQLRAQGHAAQADELEHQLREHGLGHALLVALREACETVLTAVEAIDPVSQTLLEELRRALEARLRD